MSVFNPIQQKEKKTEIELAQSLNTLTNLLKEITEFSSYELKSISLLQSDKYLKELLTFFIANKKHIKRKYSKEILDALDKISTAIANTMNSDNMFNQLIERR